VYFVGEYAICEPCAPPVGVKLVVPEGMSGAFAERLVESATVIDNNSADVRAVVAVPPVKPVIVGLVVYPDPPPPDAIVTPTILPAVAPVPMTGVPVAGVPPAGGAEKVTPVGGDE
jgi:hypothetical protein